MTSCWIIVSARAHLVEGAIILAHTLLHLVLAGGFKPPGFDDASRPVMCFGDLVVADQAEFFSVRPAPPLIMASFNSIRLLSSTTRPPMVLAAMSNASRNKATAGRGIAGISVTDGERRAEAFHEPGEPFPAEITRSSHQNKMQRKGPPQLSRKPVSRCPQNWTMTAGSGSRYCAFSFHRIVDDPAVAIHRPEFPPIRLPARRNPWCKDLRPAGSTPLARVWIKLNTGGLVPAATCCRSDMPIDNRTLAGSPAPGA